MTHSSYPTADSPEASSPRRIAIRLVSKAPRSRLRRQRGLVRSLLPVIGADDIILPSFDEKLGAFAIRAQQDDHAARDALFFAFLPKLMRMVVGLRPPFAPPGAEGVWSRHDVEQEAYLVFVELVDSWSGDVSFTAFLLSRFPWRLRDVIHRGIGKAPVPPRWSMAPMTDAVLVADDFATSPDVRDVLETLVAELPEPLGAILIAHVMEGKSKTEIARTLGVSRRTLVRYWQEIRAHTIEVMARKTSTSTG